MEIQSKLHPVLGIPMNKMPRHVAIIMDGNGRWAQKQGLPRAAGHYRGKKTIQTIIEESAWLGIKCLTLYCFSTENWKRSSKEVAMLMLLFKRYLIQLRTTVMKYNIKVKHLGREQDLPKNVRDALQKTIEISQNNSEMTLCLALNYSGRRDIIEAMKKIARNCQKGQMKIEDIDETSISSYLDTKGFNDPDLLIRTSGEMRISNFMLWQIAYTELYVTDVLWPDFNRASLHEAINTYAQRNRRFGNIS